MERLILYYICAINLITFLLYGIDKIKSKRGAWRIPEAKLLLLAAIGQRPVLQAVHAVFQLVVSELFCHLFSCLVSNLMFFSGAGST